MSSLIPFSFESCDVRFIPDGESFSVVVKDVLTALEYSSEYNPSRAVDHVPDEWKGVHRIHTLGGIQDMLTLTEQGFYFFVNRSDKPKALPFQKWIAGEVIPTIRKTGVYTAPGAKPQSADPAALAQQLADALQGKVLVDKAEWTTVRQGIDALREAFRWLDQRAKTIERTAVRFSAAPRKPSARQRPASLPDPWLDRVRDTISGRKSVTVTEILVEMGFADFEQTPDMRKRVVGLLRKLGMRTRWN